MKYNVQEHVIMSYAKKEQIFVALQSALCACEIISHYILDAQTPESRQDSGEIGLLLSFKHPNDIYLIPNQSVHIKL